MNSKKDYKQAKKVSHRQKTLSGVKRNKTIKRKLCQDMTPAEHKLWVQLKNRNFENLKFRRQHGIGPFVVDFFCPEKKLVIEVDGDVHAFTEQIEKDKQREIYLENLGLKIIRYFNDDVLNNLDGVLDDLSQRVS